MYHHLAFYISTNPPSYLLCLLSSPSPLIPLEAMEIESHLDSLWEFLKLVNNEDFYIQIESHLEDFWELYSN